MKVEAFRIGNLVNYTDDTFHTVSAVYRNGIEMESNCLRYFIDEDVISPILLTEEWLLKFGFEKNEQNYFVHGRYVIYILANKFVLYGCDVTICYVHQLQNMYFALTNEELTINTKSL